MKQYLHFDEVGDVLSSLDLLAMVVPLLDKHPSFWKWAIIAEHASLQGAMVCALRDTSGVNILEKWAAGEMLKWLNNREGEPPTERLADFRTLWRDAEKQIAWMARPWR